MGFNFLEELYVFSSKSNYVPREMYEQQKALSDKRLVLLKRCGSALVSLDNAFPNEMDVIDADLLSELAEAIDGC